MQAVRWALSFYPPFYFSKGFYDVATRACSTVDAKEGKIIEGPGYSWSDLYVTRHVTFFKFHINVPPTVNSFYWLLLNAALFLSTFRRCRGVGCWGVCDDVWCCSPGYVPRCGVAWRPRVAEASVVLPVPRPLAQVLSPRHAQGESSSWYVLAAGTPHGGCGVHAAGACLLGSCPQRRRKVLLKKREWLPSPQHLRAWLRASLGW